MVETINATVFKDSVDTKVGITLVARGGKVYVDSLSGLFGATAAEGDITVVAKRGAAVVATAVGSEAPPGKCPAGGVWGTMKYAGPKTKRNACIACLCCGPLGLCILACPGDEKDAYCVNNKVYDATGYYMGPQDDKFTPARPRS
ncbi:hypothetical protein CTEN210_06747 [Chaetoceros tenuissimus]|uniref:Uncharacterized protein n=2 Tax=Chaetoceros tenuissimus TaxID=426638 RepID=A0AAD3CS90_9STRA|nr:hypothetical protein CTEN210_06732 [Chaetoceros tenuissimus]GFH50259.1 hypothetical protein CTEN210_06735 [Chaetoceros tenuissimus]GFH50271.1 hypothetical protein CTEN210_06747 [Chaetoceros tenuissimus]